MTLLASTDNWTTGVVGGIVGSSLAAGAIGGFVLLELGFGQSQARLRGEADPLGAACAVHNWLTCLQRS